MNIVLAIAILYLGFVIAYHTGIKRSEITAIHNLKSLRYLLLLIAWLLLTVSLYFVAVSRGWETGIAIWLGLLTLCGVSSLLVAVLSPKRHLQTGALAIVIILGISVVAS